MWVLSRGPGFRWLVLLVYCTAVLTVAGDREASGEGESSYEEYQYYEGSFETRHEPGGGSEDFAYDVLDPITDDDISYSGYDYEEPVDGTVPSTVSEPAEPAGNGSRSVFDDERKPVPANGIELGTVTPSDGVPVTSTPKPADPYSCAGHQRLDDQPVFINATVNAIRMCCSPGESLMAEHSRYVSCKKRSASGKDGDKLPVHPRAIVAQFYRNCIEDMEDDIRLGVRYGNPCSTEGALVSFSERTNDTLYVIQNGSLLVITEQIVNYDVYDSYCLDFDRDDGTLVGYVCPSQVEVLVDVIRGQLFLLTICLIVAVPLLFVTAVLYTIVPDLHDLHGKALAMNCVNFAVALLLECFFQYRSRGKRMLMDNMVLENHAEYFILATFFWLLVNCANNCFHAWNYRPRRIADGWEDTYRFVVYAAIAQLIPLWIILNYSTNADGIPAVKHYFFVPIIVSLVLGLGCLVLAIYGLNRLRELYFNYTEELWSMTQNGETMERRTHPEIPSQKVNKVIYMTKYTALLFFVMAVIWSVMAISYYATNELTIFYDILFGFQGMLIFVIFICMRKPLDSIKKWYVGKYGSTVFCYSQVKSAWDVPPTEGLNGRLSRGVSQVESGSQCNPREPPRRNRNIFQYLPED